MSKHLSFATFADNYFRDKKYSKTPPIIEIVQPLLFNDESERENIEKNAGTATGTENLQ